MAREFKPYQVPATITGEWETIAPLQSGYFTPGPESKETVKKNGTFILHSSRASYHDGFVYGTYNYPYAIFWLNADYLVGSGMPFQCYVYNDLDVDVSLIFTWAEVSLTPTTLIKPGEMYKVGRYTTSTGALKSAERVDTKPKEYGYYGDNDTITKTLNNVFSARYDKTITIASDYAMSPGMARKVVFKGDADALINLPSEATDKSVQIANKSTTGFVLVTEPHIDHILPRIQGAEALELYNEEQANKAEAGPVSVTVHSPEGSFTQADNYTITVRVEVFATKYTDGGTYWPGYSPVDIQVIPLEYYEPEPPEGYFRDALNFSTTIVGRGHQLGPDTTDTLKAIHASWVKSFYDIVMIAPESANVPRSKVYIHVANEWYSTDNTLNPRNPMYVPSTTEEETHIGPVFNETETTTIVWRQEQQTGTLHPTMSEEVTYYQCVDSSGNYFSCYPNGMSIPELRASCEAAGYTLKEFTTMPTAGGYTVSSTTIEDVTSFASNASFGRIHGRCQWAGQGASDCKTHTATTSFEVGANTNNPQLIRAWITPSVISLTAGDGNPAVHFLISAQVTGCLNRKVLFRWLDYDANHIFYPDSYLDGMFMDAAYTEAMAGEDANGNAKFYEYIDSGGNTNKDGVINTNDTITATCSFYLKNGKVTETGTHSVPVSIRISGLTEAIILYVDVVRDAGSEKEYRIDIIEPSEDSLHPDTDMFIKAIVTNPSGSGLGVPSTYHCEAWLENTATSGYRTKLTSDFWIDNDPDNTAGKSPITITHNVLRGRIKNIPSFPISGASLTLVVKARIRNGTTTSFVSADGTKTIAISDSENTPPRAVLAPGDLITCIKSDEGWFFQ